MSSKANFFEMVEYLVNNNLDDAIGLYPEGYEYWQEIHNKPTITEVGQKIIACMQTMNASRETSKYIAELLGVSSRSVAGSMTKLVNDGYVAKEKNDKNITMYMLTDLGKKIKFDN